MATDRTRVATEVELTARAEGGATLGELLDHVDRRNRELGGGSFSDEQDDELQLLCWVLYKRGSRGARWGKTRQWRFLEQDIGG